MKINRIELKNFKFHQDLNFEIINNNCLIYGENGVGKSSIYWALFSIFKKKLINIDEFKNRDMREDDEINVKLTLNSEKFFTLNNESQFIDNNQEKIFFTHQDMLEEFLLYSENFYEILDDKIKLFFKKITDFSSSLYQFDIDTNEKNYREQISLRKAVTHQYEIFLNQLLIRVNNIINYHFQENFTIKFEYNWGRLDFMEYNFITPNIKLFIENESKLKLQKLKLVSIAIFFALIKLEENEVEDNSFKLLVLDDFLTSLDMANRKLIVQYILEEFEDYQKIILTHNIQFYNLIVRLLKIRDEEIKWDIKNIFLYEENNQEVATISNRNEDYLSKAENELNSYHLEVSGNFLRKEFERIVNEFEQLLELGRVEELDNVIKALQNLDFIFPEPSKNLKSISTKFNNIIANNSTDDIAKYQQLKDEIEEMPTKLRFRNNELSFLKQTILKTEFYKNILMNASSHDDTEKELYRKEFRNSIKLLKDLHKTLKNLKA